MIIRIVKLEIHPQHIEDFRLFTSRERDKILNSAGCTYLNIYQDVKYQGTFFSHSHWNCEDSLNDYRHSDFFRGNWSQVKKWFAAPPQAWSLKQAHKD